MVDPHVFVILGGTGDLAARKLLPSLYRITAGGSAHPVILAVGSRPQSDEEYQRWAAEALLRAEITEEDAQDWAREHLVYEQVARDAASYEGLRKRIEQIESDRRLPGNRAFYLALPPAAFAPTIDGLRDCGLNDGPGWRAGAGITWEGAL